MESYPLKYKLKVLVRHIANNTLGRLQRPSSKRKPNIMVFSTRRGGSTWLIELLCNEQNIKRAVEIFDVTLNHNPYKNDLPQDKDGFFSGLNPEEEARMFKYFRDIEQGKKVYNTQWKFWKKPFWYSYDRIIFKIFYAKNYIDQFQDHNNCQIIFQMRNPIPTAMSISKKGWPSAAKAFFEDPSIKQRLTPEQIEVSELILKEGSLLENHVLGWFMENLIPMTLAPERDWLVLRYEDMVVNPEATVETLTSTLDLSCSEAALDNFKKPSYNALGSQEKVAKSSPEQLCNGWKKHLNTEENPHLKAIFDAFPNPYYKWEL